ncbi:uncharacterized protein [Dysidea avara]|uniref:uncharacterized protein isoform X2 n=1 Tax=Dysidea avara TaxID=196820 RepID=UPI00332F191F
MVRCSSYYYTAMVAGVILLGWSEMVGSFNIDARRPLVVHYSPALGSDADDLFGYKIVLYTDSEYGTTRLIVSAPAGSAPGGVLRRTGLIYTCPVTSGECTGLVGNDNNPTDGRLFDLEGNSEEDGNFVEEKSGQFLGVDIQASGDQFVCCAHHYTNLAVNTVWGRCFLSDRGLRNFRVISPCDRVSTSHLSSKFGVCQAGTSVNIASNAIFGAPGALNFRGALFVDSMPVEYSMGETTQNYFGYETAVGTISSTADAVVSAIGDSNNFGSVYSISTSSLSNTSKVEGSQVGSGFGFSLATADLNNDGFDELLVGAPFFSSGPPEVGRVYVYRNIAGSLQDPQLYDGDLPYGQFGYAMVRLGDINGDGFEDVAISQPFGEGSGTVFIYNGKDSAQLMVRSQAIIGAQLNVADNLIGFGTSLSNAVDIDNNGINDFAVGSFMSQVVVLLRGLPPVNVTVTTSEWDCTTCSSDGGVYTRQTILEVCLSYSGINEFNPSEIALQVVLVGDALFVSRGNQPRIVFTSSGSSNITSELILLLNDDPVCINHTVTIMNIIDGQPLPAVNMILQNNTELSFDITGNTNIELQLLPALLPTVSGNNEVIATEDEPYSSTVQIRPQKLNLTLTESGEVSFQIRVRPSVADATDYYMLMDYSYSMRNDVAVIRTLTSSIVQTLTSTNNQIGFGVYVDKPLTPFIHVDPEYVTNTCGVDLEDCIPTFGYKHLLNLTADGTAFESILTNQKTSLNLDVPEGIFDAMLQSAVCSDILGWRDSARHVMIILTDAPPHFSGDGKLAGLVRPHDGGCYLSRNADDVWEYNRSTELDYPSVSQLAAAFEANDIIPVFTVDNRVRSLYENIVALFSNGYLETLAENSSNIVEILNNVTNLQQHSIKLVPDAVPGLNVTITPLCNTSDGETCENTPLNQEVVFNVTVRAEYCDDMMTSLQMKVPFVGSVEIAVQCNDLTPVTSTVTPSPSPITSISTMTDSQSLVTTTAVNNIMTDSQSLVTVQPTGTPQPPTTESNNLLPSLIVGMVILALLVPIIISLLVILYCKKSVTCCTTLPTGATVEKSDMQIKPNLPPRNTNTIKDDSVQGSMKIEDEPAHVSRKIEDDLSDTNIQIEDDPACDSRKTEDDLADANTHVQIEADPAYGTRETANYLVGIYTDDPAYASTQLQSCGDVEETSNSKLNTTCRSSLSAGNYLYEAVL